VPDVVDTTGTGWAAGTTAGVVLVVGALPHAASTEATMTIMSTVTTLRM
jgi:hypothetical protein